MHIYIMMLNLLLCLALLAGANADVFESNDAELAPESTIQNFQTTLQQFPSVTQVDFLNVWGWVGWTHGCGASILNELFLLSSSSCYVGSDYAGPSSRRVRAGAEYRNTGGIIFAVDLVINYDQDNLNETITNDIAIVRLQRFMTFSPVIRQASILRQGYILPPGEDIFQVGWGSNNNATNVGLSSDVIASLPVGENRDIITAFPRSGNFSFNGDIGGPWIWLNSTVGVIPRNNELWNATQVVFFATNVASYTNWIATTAV